MTRILDIAFKDLLQLTRDFKTFMFLLLMPVLFTFLFGYAFGGFSGGNSDSRLPVGYLDQDDSWLSQALHDELADSDVSCAWTKTRTAPTRTWSCSSRRGSGGRHHRPGPLRRDLPEGQKCAPDHHRRHQHHSLDDHRSRSDGYPQPPGQRRPHGDRPGGDRRGAHAVLLRLRAKPGSLGRAPHRRQRDDQHAVEATDDSREALAHTAPGMMLQFAIAGLLTSAQVIVTERKSRTLQRLLTTAARRLDILLGHYLAIFSLIFTQFLVLMAFGQFILGVNYLRVPEATLLVAFCAASCISALGLLIGVLARNEEQAVTFSLIPMFVLSGLGGAWVPLEVTGETFATIGHVSPVAWAMDGFKNISIRGLGLTRSCSRLPR
jgi:ABC-2 type transport system permease protein